MNPVQYSRYLREHRPLAEQILGDALLGGKLGFKFVSQHRIDGKFVDFCCRSHRVVIEVDGEVHDAQHEEDASRDKQLSDLGYIVLRFQNSEVIDHLDRVLARITHVCEGRPQWRY
jgi:very-short-patch-repair endonuclease